MQALDDMALLRQYTEQNSEEAFAMLVTRHVNKVYSVALRHTRNPHHAEEITQAVFAILARKARHLGRRVIISGWLCQTARLTAMTFIRSEIRRARREQEVHMQNLPNENEPGAWAQIEPLLDVAMTGLNETDYHAVVLRFFDGKSMKEVGAALGASEDAAKMRLNRAVEKLRVFFTRRGVVLPAAVLTAAISANSVQAAPAPLAKSVIVVAMTKGAAASGSTATLIQGALKIMTWTKAQTAIVAAAGVLFVAATATVTAIKIETNLASVSNAWRTTEIDSRTLDQLPPEIKILPSELPEGTIRRLHNRDNRVVELGVPVSDILATAYGMSPARMVFANGPVEGRYDFIYTMPQPPGQTLQQEVKTQLGLMARSETRDTDVLLLTVQRPNAAGLRPSGKSPAAPTSSSSSDGERTWTNASMRDMARFVENCLNMPVIDKTGLAAGYNIDLQWSASSQDPAQPDPDTLKLALLQQLGLVLVPARKPVEMLIVEKAMERAN
jgi:uncharacterized protein (TIGR03435 family)